ncbi:MAG TPA: DUF3108 domain-containing protein [Opitutaceae bacterium]|nr:DUF3108 domain-containing protein [Opitutaceae bacterium]
MLTPLLASAAPYTALRDGEMLLFRVSWGIFLHAGDIRISARREVAEGHATFRITMDTSSRGLLRGFYPYDDHAEAIIDEATGRIVSARDVGRTDDKTVSDTETLFDYTKRVASHTDRARPDRNHEFAIPEGDPVDLLSALVQTREWQAHTGDKRAVVVYVGNDLYPVTLYAEGYDQVRTYQGDLRALRLVPRMDSAEPRGIFKRGGEIKVWVSQDGDRQPVKMQLKLKFGTAMLTLVEHKTS